MSFPGQSFQFPTAYYSEDPDPRVPLQNLDSVRTRMNSLQLFLTQSINNDALITPHQMDMVSAGISSAIHEIISNGAALLACSRIPRPDPNPDPTRKPEVKKEEENNDDDDGGGGGDSEIVEVDAVELLAEHIHYCEICGKGFKRDANLRMHMRAHGNQFKTPEALAKPEKIAGSGEADTGGGRNTRFSCPYVGCNRNKGHAKFRALKSVICVKNHFKRSHCPKMYSCNRCNKKSFSVVADLKSHLKHCGEARWRCTCGTSFSRKSKLFGHMALFEGHMPAVEDDNKGAASCLVTAMEEEEDGEERHRTTSWKGEGEGSNPVYEDIELSDELFSGLGTIEGFCLEDMFVDL
ncbi:protein SENSITIVE TO PROTON RHIZOTOXICITY 1-like [Rosa sericea]